MLDTNATYKVYGIAPHELRISQTDDFSYTVLFDNSPIGTGWSFNEEPITELVEAIRADRIFATRWEANAKHAERSKHMSDFENNKMLDDDSLSLLRDYKKAGLPAGLSAFLTILNINSDTPLTIDNISSLQETGAVIQMDSANYDSTLEIVSYMKKKWNDKVINSVLRNFGKTLIQEQEIAEVLSMISPKIAEETVDMNSPTLHFLTIISKDIEELSYKNNEISLLLSEMNKIQTSDAWEIERIRNAWSQNHNTEDSPLPPELFKTETIGIEQIECLMQLYQMINHQSNLSINRQRSMTEIHERMKEYASLVFATVVFLYGTDQIVQTMKDHSGEYENLFHLLVLLDYEMDGSYADANLVLSMFDAAA